MKKLFKKLFRGICITIGIILSCLVGITICISCIQMTPPDYVKTVKTGGPLEAKYLAVGPYSVQYMEVAAAEPMKQIAVYYPTDMADGVRYPVVVFINGTGVYASKYKALFHHLASWGFIVAGNEDPSTWSGKSADETLGWLLAENEREGSVLYNRIDTGNIGVSGHSQGGVGVFNAITINKRSGLYKTAVALSPTQEEGAAALKMPYDVTKVTIPLLMVAGTKGDFEIKLVIPLESMKRMYSRITAPKAMMRRIGGDHGQMLYSADGYVTAWFLWLLQGNEEAGKAFNGDSPELLDNPLYSEQAIDLQGLRP